MNSSKYQTSIEKPYLETIIEKYNLSGVLRTKYTPFPHLRILRPGNRTQILNALAEEGYVLEKASGRNRYASGKTSYQDNTYTYTKEGIVYTLVLASIGAEDSGQIGIQQLRPSNLNLSGKELTKEDLVIFLNLTIPKLVDNKPLCSGLLQLVEIADGTREKLDSAEKAFLKGIRKVVVQDFGEVLAPLVLASTPDTLIRFPNDANHALVDCWIDDQPVSVKSLSGSGNGFSAARDLIELYNSEQDSLCKVSKIITEFAFGEGSICDKILRVSELMRTPEAAQLYRQLGKIPKNFSELLQCTNELYRSLTQHYPGNEYVEYLKWVLPIAKAGGHKYKTMKSTLDVIGLPRDFEHYLYNKPLLESISRSGKAVFDVDFVDSASKQLVYTLGVGIAKQFQKEPLKTKFKSVFGSIMSQRDAIGAQIDINEDGEITVTTTQFKRIDWEFQYHAATNAPARNSPGFKMVL